MISSAHYCVTWRPALPKNAGACLSSSSCSLVSCATTSVDSHGFSSSPPCPRGVPSRGRPETIVSASDLSFQILNAGHCSSHNNSISSTSSQSGVSLPRYHQNRRIELKRFRVVVQNGELRFRRSANVGISRADCENPQSPPAATQTRRDLLIRSSSAILTVTSYLGSKEAAEASAQLVKLQDVENEKLQDALRAAVAGDLENAEKLFTQLIKEEPTSASGWSNRGSVRISLGKFELATADFTKAIELAPEAPVPYLNRAISLEAVGRFDEAIADCKTAIERDPEEPAAWYNLGNVQARVKDFNSSLVAYQRASLLAPGIAGYRFRQALVLFQVGKLGEAKKLLQGLVRKYPNYTEAHAALAALLWTDGQQSNAEEQFSQATNREPLYGRISWVETELQWPPGVLQAFAKFLSIDYSKS